jgi:hypothetical protein
MKNARIRVTVLSLLLPAAAWGALTTPSTIFRQGANGLTGTAATNDYFGNTMAVGNFNGDGYMDLAIGTPYDNGWGSVTVLWGTSGGLVVTAHQYITQTLLSINGGDELSEAGDSFGGALCAGDFDGDGFDDLAISAQFEKFGSGVGAIPNAGMMSVVYGSELGLDLERREFWHQDTPGLEGSVEANDTFGGACAAGDFNNDGRDDLAIGITGENTNAGEVQLLYGGSGGISTSGDKLLRQGETPVGQSVIIGLEGTSMITDHAEPRDNERFGYVLAVGKFDGDAYDDLVIGVPFDEFAQGISLIIAGGFHIAFGSSSGIAEANNLYFNEGTVGFPDSWEASDQLGISLAVGRFNLDAYDDLVVGAPGEAAGAATNAGIAVALFGSAAKATVGAGGYQELKQGNDGLEDAQELNDKFGQTMVAGRYPEGSSELDYVIIGAVGETVGAINKAGSLNAIYATPTGLHDAEENQFLNQNVANFGDACEANDRLGLSLASGDFNGDGSPDLAIGVPEEDLNASITNSGIVQILYFPGEPVLFADGFASGTTAAWSFVEPAPLP